MEIDLDKQQKAQENTRKLLVKEEDERSERRFFKLVLELENGNNDVLLNDELMENLPDLVSTYAKSGDRNRVKTLFEKLDGCTSSENVSLRERAVMALSLCMEGLNLEEHPDLIEQVTQILIRWLRVETVFLSVCNIVCSQLKNNGVLLLEEGRWEECNYLLESFCQIQSGTHDISNAIKSVVGRAQDGMATDYILEELTIVCLRGRGERRQNAEKILVLLGRKAAIFLLDTLLSCQEKEDRFRLVGLIPATGYVAVDVLKMYLLKDLPWYGFRNIILMITAMNDRSLIPLIMPCLTHQDIRIQQQVIDCITEVIQDTPEEFLLEALPLVDDRLKSSLVGSLGQYGGADVLEAFLDLLSQRDSFTGIARDELLKSLVIQVRLSDSIRAVNLVKQLIEERSRGSKSQTDPVLLAATQSLMILEPRFAPEEASQKTDESTLPIVEEVSFDKDPVALRAAQEDVEGIESEVKVLVDMGQINEAGLLLYEKCIEAAKEKRFEVAEMLKDRILDVNPNALAEVIQAGEIIQEESLTNFSSSHIKVWQDLFDTLTTDEFDSLYNTLKTDDYGAGSVVVEQGTDSPCLYFVNSGQAKLTCFRGDEEIFLKKIGPGEIIGTDPFFDSSLWTVSLTVLGKVNISKLERQKFLDLLKEYPSLESRLSNFCLQSENVKELLEMSGEDRREYPRFPVSVIVKHTLLDESGVPNTRSFNGEIVDISCGGLSFYIKISSRENSRLLLGRGIQTNIKINENNFAECRGEIVAVRPSKLAEGEFSVHVRFDEPIASTIVNDIVAL